MKHKIFTKAVLCCSLMAMIVLSTQVCAQSSRSRRGGLYGDWQVKTDFSGRQMESILSFSRNREGNQTGQWISFMRLSELKDVKFEEGRLSFSRVSRNRDGQSTTSKFTGTITDGKLSGTMSSDRGEYKLEGTRSPRMPRVVGSWEMKYSFGEREVTSTLVINADKKGNLSGKWQSRWGESQVADVQYERGNLTFKRTSTYQGNQRESTFEGTVKRDTLSGVIKSERGEIAAEGKRLDAALIGTWDIEVTSERGNREQRLLVNPDMSGLYGAIPIKKVSFDSGQVGFKIVRQFADRQFEMSFAGKLEDSKLTGELSSSRGSQKVTGRKRSPTPARQRVEQATVPSREPDVIFVPTPPEAVDKMLELAEVTKDDLLYDLGCGDGRIVVTAAKRYGCKAIGYDIDPERVKESLENVQKNNVGHLVRIEQKDIFTLDLSEANVITLYLLPSLNVKLIPQLEKLKPGSRIVSHDFRMRGIKPEKVVKLTSDYDQMEHKIFLWTSPLKKTVKEEAGYDSE